MLTLPAANYPRSAVAVPSLWNYNASATKRVISKVFVSTDGGATWFEMPNSYYMAHTVAPGQYATLVSPSGRVDLAAGVTYSFALGAFTNDPAPTISGDCTLRVDVFNRSPTSAPFDTPEVQQQRFP